MKRILAVAGGLSVGLVAMAATAVAQEKVTFGTNWKAQAEHGGFYQSVADGTYKACGLDVTIAPGGPQVNNRALLPVGKLDFLMGGNLLESFNAVDNGIPTIVVAASFQKEPQILTTHPGQGLDTWESLKNAEVILTSDAGFNSYFQWMITEFGFKAEQRRPYTFNMGPFLANKKWAQQGYLSSEPFAIEREGGFKPNVFLIADYGFDTYSTTIETRTELVEKKPKVVECFVNGSILGWYTFLYGDNSAARALIQKDNPDMTNEMIDYGIAKMKEYGIVDSGDTEKLGIGAMTDARVKSFFDKMVKAGVVKGTIDYKKAYSTAFVNKGLGLDVRKKLTGK